MHSFDKDRPSLDALADPVQHQAVQVDVQAGGRARAVDKRLFLMILAFVPVPTALIGAYPSAVTGSIIYGAVLALAGLAFMVMRVYITQHGALLHEAVPAAAARQAVRKALLSPILYALGAALAMVDTRLAWCVYVIVPLIYILPGAFDRINHQTHD